MPGYLLAPLMNRPSPHFDLSKTRLETLAIMLAGLANGRTVNLSHLAIQFPGTALHASSYRCLQRFFQYVRLDGDVVARLIVRLLNLNRPGFTGGFLVEISGCFFSGIPGLIMFLLCFLRRDVADFAV